EAFTAWDKDGDGRLTRFEFEEALGRQMWDFPPGPGSRCFVPAFRYSRGRPRRHQASVVRVARAAERASSGGGGCSLLVTRSLDGRCRGRVYHRHWVRSGGEGG
ncbi:unnamed protein product, partial [Ascophyllum nodosum]